MAERGARADSRVVRERLQPPASRTGSARSRAEPLDQRARPERRGRAGAGRGGRRVEAFLERVGVSFVRGSRTRTHPPLSGRSARSVANARRGASAFSAAARPPRARALDPRRACQRPQSRPSHQRANASPLSARTCSVTHSDRRARSAARRAPRARRRRERGRHAVRVVVPEECAAVEPRDALAPSELEELVRAFNGDVGWGAVRARPPPCCAAARRSSSLGSGSPPRTRPRPDARRRAPGWTRAPPVAVLVVRATAPRRANTRRGRVVSPTVHTDDRSPRGTTRRRGRAAADSSPSPRIPRPETRQRLATSPSRGGA